LAITVVAAPSFDVTIASSQTTPYCQTTATTTDNTAATHNSLNTITYTVSRGTVSNPPASYTWGYTISVPNTSSPLGTYAVKIGATDITSIMPYTVSGIASTTATQDITVTFYSTTGLAAQTLTGTVSAGKVTDLGSGGATYDESASPNHYDVTIKAVPTIGSFL
jgi:hypothetical protein